LGIVPTRPETGYGYLKVGPNDGSQTASAVERFVEKPDATTATTYLADGNYLWNAGLFFFRASTMLAEFDRQLPELATTLRQIRADLTTDRAQDTLHRLFPTLASVSIDYGIMEGAQDVRVIPTQCGWSDVGHWDALPDLLPADGLGNILQGDTIAHDTHDTIVLNQHDDHLVALVGVHNLVVVTTDDATLVLPRSRAQEVRAIVKALQNARRDDLL
ncbi:MAG: sugar phosphate nucleotidyltransferase, partial [Myxococcota bacterium]